MTFILVDVLSPKALLLFSVFEDDGMLLDRLLGYDLHSPIYGPICKYIHQHVEHRTI